ncbi:MAG TPA: DUF6081 family protein [Longimicrobium sp.]|nr:DUF6081 family protein [Longimicrobium sp.]
MMKHRQSVLGVLWVVCTLGAGPALAHDPILWDDFTSPSGFAADSSDARWFHLSSGPVVANDGIETLLPEGGLRVVAKGVRSSTGEPAFTLTQDPDESDGIPGQADHIKWLVYMNHAASSGYPGFDAVAGQELTCETWISGRTYGTAMNPFWMAGIPQNDVRLATFAQTTTDFETGMAFDFLFTNNKVYAAYERTAFQRTPQHPYASFLYAVPVATRSSLDAQHRTQIAYNRQAGVVRWILDGVEVFRVSKIGRRLTSRANMLLEHGGVEETVDMRQLDCGLGMFTLLDGDLNGMGGLVRLTNQPNFYYMPSMGMFGPQWFWDEASQPGSRVFGQGAELRVPRYQVTTTYVP